MHPEVSIVIPVKDEDKNIDALAKEIDAAFAPVDFSWECLWIDDGSTDDTAKILTQLHDKNPHHRFVLLTRNFGQSAALSVGFQNARGDILATLDGDGQNDPNDIPRLVKLLREHDADMVNGVRRKRHDSFVRKISSRIANGFRNRVTGDNITDVGCSLRVFRSKCVKRIPVFKGMHRFFPTLVRIQGFSQIIESPVNHRPRIRGETKYGIQNRLWVGLADLGAVKWMQSRLVFPEVQSQASASSSEEEK
ncbi:MAG: Undecaprenyl-phosphate 4-deoxy-4-formamido-L-arabinose transferase [Syntrophorhabdus sp. PtaU1.Bin153]|nr:MAG: Undecaprenyl-phosphate 4-deoxy-4-formamido-L-arabinose transferase [Syntrophorhabdus sp. PtaU1.Bin153]